MFEEIGIDKTVLDGIHQISKHYTKENQIEKAKEELRELLAELESAKEINDTVTLPGNTWSEVADVMIMCIQITMQHGKIGKVMDQIKYKVNRQLKRIREEINEKR